MAWQTPEMTENDAKLNVVQSGMYQHYQGVNRSRRFAVAPMIDCTHRF